MEDKLSALSRYTVIVADTGDIAQIKATGAQDCTTNPSLILKAASKPEYARLMDEAVAYAAGHETAPDARVELALDKLAVNFGAELTRIVPGYVSTEVDARLSFDTASTVRRAERLIALYREAGIDPARILIKIAATWEGVKAAAALKEQRHRLQPDPDLQQGSGGALRRGGCLPDLTLRRANHGLVQGARH